MKTKGSVVSENSMAFYHPDGFIATWNQARKFAGAGGRIATMPDIVDARLATKPGDAPWETYYTTLTAEYYGFSKTGKLILIVAHGIGPMATLNGIQKAYSWEYQDKTRRKNGGRIYQEEFWDLEAGKYGDVAIIPFEEYSKRYKYPFLQILQSSQARTDPVLAARLGPRAEEYVLAHRDASVGWHLEQAGIKPENKHGLSEEVHRRYLSRRENLHVGFADGTLDPYVIGLRDAANCSYFGRDARIPEKGYALAHLISTGRFCATSHDSFESLTLDISCHEWWNGTRLVGIKSGESIASNIQSGPDARELLHKHWKDLLEPVFPSDIKSVGFCALMQVGDQWFTQYPKQGERMDTHEPEYMVTSIEKISEPVLFRTTVGGYHGFFEFGINEVRSIAPPTANAYCFVSEPENEWNDGNPTHQKAMVQFFYIKADTSKRLMRAKKLSHDFKRMMEFL